MEYNVEVTVSPAAMARLCSRSVPNPENGTSIVLMAGRTKRLVRAAELLDDGGKDVGDKGDKGGEGRRACETVQVGVSGFIPLPDDEDSIQRIILELAPIRILGTAFIRDGPYVRSYYELHPQSVYISIFSHSLPAPRYNREQQESPVEAQLL